MSKLYTALGLMSGTSMDGVDAALIRTDGEKVERLGDWLTLPYDTAFREQLQRAVAAQDVTYGKQLEHALTRHHAEAVAQLLTKAGLSSSDIDVIGFHGHTVSHRPESGKTWQIGDGGLLAALTGVGVVYDFRSNDMAYGGQGAPLAPLYHRALLRECAMPLAVLNIGGVANVTYINGEELLAFDTGPGNALLDDWVLHHTGKYYDENGSIAGKGVADASLVHRLLSHPYFNVAPPKSLDRNDFTLELLQDLSLEDGAATLVAFTAQAVQQSCGFLPQAPRQWYVTGGGRHNPAIMQALDQALQGEVLPIESADANGDSLEAEAFAFLAVRSLNGQPLSVPGTTGVKTSVTGGVFCSSLSAHVPEVS